MPRTSAPNPEMVISDAEALKVISDPLRLEILELLSADPERGWTAKEVARSLGVGQTKLYRHLGLMAKHGFLRIAETRMVSGILERRYAAAARGYRVARELLTGTTGEAALASTLDALFDKARAEIVAGLHAGLIDTSGSAPQRNRVALNASHVRLSPAGVRKVMRYIERLIALEELDDPDGTHYGLLLAFYPRADGETDR